MAAGARLNNLSDRSALSSRAPRPHDGSCHKLKSNAGADKCTRFKRRAICQCSHIPGSACPAIVMYAVTRNLVVVFEPPQTYPLFIQEQIQISGAFVSCTAQHSDYF